MFIDEKRRNNETHVAIQLSYEKYSRKPVRNNECHITVF